MVRFDSGITSIGSCGTSSTLPDACGTSGAIRRKRACGLGSTFCTKATWRELWGRRYNTALPLFAGCGVQSGRLPISEQRRYDAALLLSEFVRRADCALRNLAVRQSPRALPAKWQGEEFPKCQLVFLAISSNADGNSVLWDIAAQRPM